jgi:hypothetical protein
VESNTFFRKIYCSILTSYKAASVTTIIERNIFEKMCQLGNIDHNNIQPNISIAFKKEENKKCGADFKEFFENNNSTKAPSSFFFIFGFFPFPI